MNYIPFSNIILIALLVAVQSCTPEPIQTSAPQSSTLIHIVPDALENRAVGVTFRYDPERCQVWSNLVFEDNRGIFPTLGQTYHCVEENWFNCQWKPTHNQFDFSTSYEIVQYKNPELYDHQNCGNIKEIFRMDEDGLYKIRFEVDDDFVNCLDNTSDEIKLDIVIIL